MYTTNFSVAMVAAFLPAWTDAVTNQFTSSNRPTYTNAVNGFTAPCLFTDSHCWKAGCYGIFTVPDPQNFKDCWAQVDVNKSLIDDEYYDNLRLERRIVNIITPEYNTCVTDKRTALNDEVNASMNAYDWVKPSGVARPDGNGYFDETDTSNDAQSSAEFLKRPEIYKDSSFSSCYVARCKKKTSGDLYLWALSGTIESISSPVGSYSTCQYDDNKLPSSSSSQSILDTPAWFGKDTASTPDNWSACKNAVVSKFTPNKKNTPLKDNRDAAKATLDASTNYNVKDDTGSQYSDWESAMDAYYAAYKNYNEPKCQKDAETQLKSWMGGPNS